MAEIGETYILPYPTISFSMARRPYCVEVDYPVKGSPRYFLVRDVRVGERKTKVKRYLCSGNPVVPKVNQVLVRLSDFCWMHHYWCMA